MLKKDQVYKIWLGDLDDDNIIDGIYKGMRRMPAGEQAYEFYCETIKKTFLVNSRNWASIRIEEETKVKKRKSFDNRFCKETIKMGDGQRIERGKPKGNECPYTDAQTDPKCDGCVKKPAYYKPEEKK